MSDIPTRKEREEKKPIGWLYKRLVNKHLTGPPLDGQIQMDGVWGTPSTQLNFTPELPTERWIYWQSPVYSQDAIDTLEQRLAAAEADTARRCAEMAMERCRLLNGDAVAQIRSGRAEMASVTEIKADQFEWMANAIRREFK